LELSAPTQGCNQQGLKKKLKSGHAHTYEDLIHVFWGIGGRVLYSGKKNNKPDAPQGAAVYYRRVKP
jgi:hypothetical protein